MQVSRKRCTYKLRTKTQLRNTALLSHGVHFQKSNGRWRHAPSYVNSSLRSQNVSSLNPSDHLVGAVHISPNSDQLLHDAEATQPGGPHQRCLSFLCRAGSETHQSVHQDKFRRCDVLLLLSVTARGPMPPSTLSHGRVVLRPKYYRTQTYSPFVVSDIVTMLFQKYSLHRHGSYGRKQWTFLRAAFSICMNLLHFSVSYHHFDSIFAFDQ